MTTHPTLFAALAAPFDPSEVKVRPQSGRQIPYVTARTIMNRLDNVLGPENWFDEYIPGENSVLCKLTIRLPDGAYLTKCDAGGYAGMADSGDDDKSGFSDSFKRAAVKFGVGRYMYRDGVPHFAQEAAHSAGQNAESAAPSAGPAPAQPKASVPVAPNSSNTNGTGNPPRSGKALFAWTKEQEERYSVGLLKYLNGWAKLQKFPQRMVDWDAEQVALAYAEASRKLRPVASEGSAALEEALSN